MTAGEDGGLQPCMQQAAGVKPQHQLQQEDGDTHLVRAAVRHTLRRRHNNPFLTSFSCLKVQQVEEAAHCEVASRGGADGDAAVHKQEAHDPLHPASRGRALPQTVHQVEIPGDRAAVHLRRA